MNEQSESGRHPVHKLSGRRGESGSREQSGRGGWRGGGWSPGHMRSPVEGENLVHMSSPVGVAPLMRAALALKLCMGWSGEESFIA